MPPPSFAWRSADSAAATMPAAVARRTGDGHADAHRQEGRVPTARELERRARDTAQEMLRQGQYLLARRGPADDPEPVTFITREGVVRRQAGRHAARQLPQHDESPAARPQRRLIQAMLSAAMTRTASRRCSRSAS